MDTKSYLRTLIPEGSFLIVALQPVGQGPKGAQKRAQYEQHADPAEAENRLRALNRAGFDVYVKTAVFGTERRSDGRISLAKTNVTGSSNMDLDVDAGPGKPYATPDEARLATNAALKALGIPEPTLIIMSGHGVRYIWHFTTPLTHNAWLMEAKQFGKVLAGAGVHYDRQALIDITRGIRIPGTLNYKDPAAPVSVVVLHQGPHTSIQAFRQAIHAESGGLSAYVSADDLKAKTHTPKKLHYRIANIGDRCPLLAHTIDTGGADHDEPAWMLILQLLACAEDGEEWIHKVGDQHPGYTPVSTELKFKQRFDTDGEPKAGPPLCTTLAGPQCKTCPHKGLISTPARLGVIIEGRLPPGYSTRISGTFRDIEDGQEFVSSTRFLDASLARLQTDGAAAHKGGQLVMRVQFLNPGYQHGECIMPLSALSNSREFRRVLLEEGINATSTGMKQDPLMTLMGSWLEHLQRTNAKEEIIEQIGWIESAKGGHKGFALPHIVFRDGDVLPDVYPQVDAGLRQVYRTKGSLELWRKGAQAIIDGGQIGLAIAIAAAMASPLIRFTNIAGGILSFSSSYSGTGKTTAMWAGASVWGDPLRSVLLADDTSNSVLGRIGRAPSMPVYWDEIFTQWSNDKARELISNLFRLAQGREKSRMRSTREIMPGTSWQTLICVASNYRVMDAVRSIKQQSQANLARVIEIDVPRIRKSDPVVDYVTENYGHAGVLYAQWLSANAEKLAETVRGRQHHIMKTYFRGDVQTRFWAATIASIEIAARISNMLGLLRFDPDAMVKALLNAIDAQLVTHAEDRSSSVADILMAYLAESRDSLCASKWVNGKDSSNGCITHLAPQMNRSIVAYHYLDTEEWQVAYKPFRYWLTRQSYNASEVLEKLIALPGCSRATGLFGDQTALPSGRQPHLKIDARFGKFKAAGLSQLGRPLKG